MLKVYLSLVIASTLLAGCSAPHSNRPQQVSVLPPVTYQTGELNRETLFDIVSAEMAGHQKRFELAQTNYLKQAELTGDPGVIRRAIRIAQYNKDTQALLKASKIWIAHEPDSSEPFEIVASILLHERQFAAAQPYIRKALTRQSQRILALINTQAARLPTAIASAYLSAIEPVLKEHPKRADLWMTRGLLQKRLKQNQGALQSLTQAARYNPDNLNALLNKADILRELKHYDRALNTLKPAKKRAPNNKQVLLAEIQILYAANRNQQAVKRSFALLNRLPEDDQLQVYLAILALDHKQLDVSEQWLTTLQKKSPRPDLNFYRGIIAEQRGQKNVAIKLYIETTQGHNILQAYSRAVALHTSLSQRNTVAQIITTGIQRHSKLSHQLFHLHADWLRSYGDQVGATAALDEGLKAHPDNTNLIYARAMLRPPQEFTTAEKELRFVLEKEPNNALAMNALGYTLALYTTRLDEALKLLERAIALKPNDPAIIDSYGWALYKVGQLQTARQHLERAFTLLEDPEVGGHLVVVLAALNEHKSARALYNKLQKQFPDHQQLQLAKKVLSQ